MNFFDPGVKKYDMTPQPAEEVSTPWSVVGEFIFPARTIVQRINEPAEFHYDMSPQEPVMEEIYPATAVPSGKGHLFVTEHPVAKSKQAERPYFVSQGRYHGVADNKVYVIDSKKNAEMVVPATLHIVGVTYHYENDTDYEVFYAVEVQSGRLPEPILMEVQALKFTQIFDILRKEHPEIPLFCNQNNSKNALTEYISDVVSRDVSTCEVRHVPKYSGWFAPTGELPRYRLGDDEFYSDWQVSQVPAEYRSNAIMQGMTFLNLGTSPTVGTLWLFSHIAYTLYWLREAKQEFASVLYLNGESGALKTAVAKVVAFPFMRERGRSKMRLASTSASIKDFLLLSKDSVALLDDSSGSEQTNQRQINTNSEIAIRSVSDGTIDAKMNTATRKVKHESCRLALILTGEDKLQLGRSSQLRLIECPVDRETFDGEILGNFQHKPEILNEYFATYIDYLTERGPELMDWISLSFDEYRREFAEQFSVRRFVDSAAGLSIIADIIADFMQWACVANSVVVETASRLHNDAVEIMMRNQEAEVDDKPTVVFLENLFELLDNHREATVAENEDDYTLRPVEFIGFYERETDSLWIKPLEAYNLVVQKVKITGRFFSTSLNKLKEMLYNEGFTEGRQVKGKCEYVKRAKLGRRKYFLVFNLAKIKNEIFKED